MYFFLTFIIFLFATLLFRIVSGESLFRMNFISYCYWVLLLIALIPSFFILHGEFILWDNDPWITDFIGTNKNLYLFVHLTILWSICIIPLTLIFLNIFFNKKVSFLSIGKLTFVKFDIGYGFTEKKLFFLLFTLITIISFFIYSNSVSHSPILKIINGDSVSSMIIERKDFKLGFDNSILNAFFNEDILLLFLLSSLIIYFNFNSKKWFIFSLFQFINIFIIIISKGSISTIVALFLQIFYLRNLIKGVFIKIQELFLFLLSITLLFIILKGSDGNLITVLLGPFKNRVFSQVLGYYYSFQIFPTKHDFLYFTSTGKILNQIFGTQPSDSNGVIMMNYFSAKGVESLGAGHLTSIFLAEAWANFGYYGIFFAPFIVAFYVFALYFIFLKIKKNVFNLALFSYFSISIPYDRDFITFYYPLGIILFAIGYYTILYFLKFFNNLKFR